MTLFLQVLVLAHAVSIARRITPQRKIARLLKTPENRNLDDSQTPETDKFLWALGAVTRRCPWLSCLDLALTAVIWLRQKHHSPNVRLGVRHAGRKLEAHAWVEYQGRIITGNDAAGAPYRPLRQEDVHA